MTDRRSLIKYGFASFAALEALRAAAQIRMPDDAAGEPNPGYQRIGCEAAWTTQAIVDARVARAESAWAAEQPYVASMALGFARNRRFQDPLQDIGAGRIAAMDRLGVQKQGLMLTAPGVQMLDADTGTGLAADANDRLAEAIRSHPDRFAGLTVIAPQDPRRAAPFASLSAA